MDALEKFIENLLAEKLEPYLKSEAVPASNDDPVKVKLRVKYRGFYNNWLLLLLLEHVLMMCTNCLVICSDNK